MHQTALMNAKHFFDCYGPAFDVLGTPIRVVEIGSQDINGSIRIACPQKFEYIGVDFRSGKGVDVVLDDPYTLPFNGNSVDIVVSSSCFEHSEMFWIVFLEILRVLKPRGLFYLNAPSNGYFHRHPVDCWRFYPDSGRALVTWANRNGISAILLESYTSGQGPKDCWNDFVAVFLKDEAFTSEFKDRIIYTKEDISNGLISNTKEFIKYRALPEDKAKLIALQEFVNACPRKI